MRPLTAEDYFGRMSRASGETPSSEVQSNASDLLLRVNGLLEHLSLFCQDKAIVEPAITSGWRTGAYNQTIAGAAARSRHITGQAVDLADPGGVIDDLLFSDWQRFIDSGLVERCLLAKFGLSMEHPLATKNWCHLQTPRVRSGNLVFFP